MRLPMVHRIRAGIAVVSLFFAVGEAGAGITDLFRRDSPPPRDYVILINYELGMHCTGFDFSYCCVLPP